jgi:hypothetical protein
VDGVLDGDLDIDKLGVLVSVILGVLVGVILGVFDIDKLGVLVGVTDCVIGGNDAGGVHSSNGLTLIINLTPAIEVIGDL